MIERRHWPIIALLVLLAAGSQLLLWLVREPAKVDFVGPPRSDYTLSNFNLTALGDDGKLSFRMTGPLLTRSDRDRSIYATTPAYVMVDGSGRPWQGKSDAAWIDKAGTIMQLRGDVLMRSETDGKPTSTITSSDVTIWPKTNKLSTDAKATIEQPGSIVRGTGLRADLTTHTMELLADVHSTFEPKTRSR
ncbi:MAG: LPS export ABC transporter periplasmic protein LptC [Dokdonella sp.]